MSNKFHIANTHCRKLHIIDPIDTFVHQCRIIVKGFMELKATVLLLLGAKKRLRVKVILKVLRTVWCQAKGFHRNTPGGQTTHITRMNLNRDVEPSCGFITSKMKNGGQVK